MQNFVLSTTYVTILRMPSVKARSQPKANRSGSRLQEAYSGSMAIATIVALTAAYLLFGGLIHRKLIRDAALIKCMNLTVNAVFYVLAWPPVALAWLAFSAAPLLRRRIG
jgi:hypothetical protein